MAPTRPERTLRKLRAALASERDPRRRKSIKAAIYDAVERDLPPAAR